MKNLIKVIFISLLIFTLASCNKKEDAKTFEVKESISYDGVFDYSPLCDYTPKKLYVENKSGRIDHVFSVDTKKNFVYDKNYIKDTNTSEYEGAVNVYFDYLQNYEGIVSDPEAEYLAVQLAILGRIKGYDPINLTITANEGDKFKGRAKWIREFAHELYISDYVFKPSSTMRLHVYNPKTGEVSSEADNYDLTGDSTVVVADNGKSYWVTDYLTVRKGQTDYIEGAVYSITLDPSAPEGTMVVDSNDTILGNSVATFDENSGSKGFRLLIPYNINANGSFVVSLNGTVKRGTATLFRSATSSTLLGLEPSSSEENTVFVINYIGK